MGSPNWKKGLKFPYVGIRRIVMEQLNISDRRAVEKWIGKSKTVWKKIRPALAESYNKKIEEWQKGLLEEFWIIQKIPLDDYNETMYKNVVWFKILKDKTDFEDTI